MKKFILLLLFMSIAGCQCSTRYGDCIGVADDPEPGMRYEASIRNIILALIFIETIFVPAYVLLSDLKCPVGPVTPVVKK